MTDTLTAPTALTDAYAHLRAALRDLKVVTWQIDIPDMCCDEHFEVRDDSMWPVDDAVIAGMLVDSFVELAETHGELPDTDIAGRGGAWGQATDALYKALRPESGVTPDVEVLEWASALPYDAAAILVAVRASMSSNDLGVTCDPAQARVRLDLGKEKTAHVRDLTDEEIDALTTLP